ncbi:MAG: hypothetical protein ACYCUM_11485 [Solirubrobacteraceae bacterium]
MASSTSSSTLARRRARGRWRLALPGGRAAWRRRLGLPCALALATLSAAAGLAHAAQERASLHASFTPDRLAASTTIAFSFEVRSESGLAPPPLTGLDLHMPAGMNYVNTTLGLALCSRHTLEAKGAAGCPANSKLGSGSAEVEVPFGSGAGHELPAISAWMGPPTHGNMVILFYVNGKTPVYGQFIFGGEVLPQTGIFGSELAASVPLVRSVPGGPDVSIVRADASIGPRGLAYYHDVHGRRRRFQPRGIAVPQHCPKSGFPFSAQFSFQDGSTAQASTTVPCPKHGR